LANNHRHPYIQLCRSCMLHHSGIRLGTDIWTRGRTDLEATLVPHDCPISHGALHWDTLHRCAIALQSPVRLAGDRYGVSQIIGQLVD